MNPVYQGRGQQEINAFVEASRDVIEYRLNRTEYLLNNMNEGNFDAEVQDDFSELKFEDFEFNGASFIEKIQTTIREDFPEVQKYIEEFRREPNSEE